MRRPSASSLRSRHSCKRPLKRNNSQEEKTTMRTQTQHVNGIDLEGLGQLVEQIKNDNAKGFVRFKVASVWKGQTRSETRVKSYVVDGVEIPREFSIVSDE